MKRDRVVLPVSTVVLAAVLFVSALSGSPMLAGQPKEPIRDDVAALKELQKERIDTLTHLVKLLFAQYQTGRGSARELLAADNELINARLDFADKPEQRIALLETQVEMARKTFELARRRMEAAVGPQSEVEWAKAHLLGVQIKLVRERMRQRAGS